MIKVGDVLRIRKDSNIIPAGCVDSVVVIKIHRWGEFDYAELRVQQIDMLHRILYVLKKDLL